MPPRKKGAGAGAGGRAKSQEEGSEESEPEQDEGIGAEGDSSDGEGSEEEIEIEVDLDGDGRIAGTRGSGLDLSPFRAWRGQFAAASSAGGAGKRATINVIKEDCETWWATEELHGGSFLVPAAWDAKQHGRPGGRECSLERLARDVFERHTAGCEFDASKSGAEWWVQVREGGDGQGAKDKGKRKRAEAAGEGARREGIGFHWDKDEDLVDQLDVQVNPQISTVTYLTDFGAPTMVLAKLATANYSDSERMYRGGIKEGWLSHPEAGKHIAFDGRLLHGAPKLLARPDTTLESRVTFLVNIWLNYLPLGLEPLPEKHVKRLSSLTVPRILLIPPDGKPRCEAEQLLVRRRTPGGLWISEAFGPTGTEHVLEFPWPRCEERGGQGVVGFRFAAGSEARIAPGLGAKRAGR